jgi:hypothetical protein
MRVGGIHRLEREEGGRIGFGRRVFEVRLRILGLNATLLYMQFNRILYLKFSHIKDLSPQSSFSSERDRFGRLMNTHDISL